MNNSHRTEQEICKAILDLATDLYRGLGGDNYPRILVASAVLLLLKRAAEYCKKDLLSAYHSLPKRDYDGTDDECVVALKTYAADLIRYCQESDGDKWSVAITVASLVWRAKHNFSEEITDCARKDVDPPNGDIIEVVGIWPATSAG